MGPVHQSEPRQRTESTRKAELRCPARLKQNNEPKSKEREAIEEIDKNQVLREEPGNGIHSVDYSTQDSVFVWRISTEWQAELSGDGQRR